MELTRHMQAMAKAGRKASVGIKPSEQSGAAFLLYHNEMVHTNNTILTTSRNNKTLYTTLSNPNYLRTSDVKMCTYMEGWFQRVIQKSNAISLQSERSREWFFNRLRRKINLAMQRMEVEIGEGI